MESFELPGGPESRRRKKSSSLIWNVLTILVLLATVCVASLFIYIFLNPTTELNPFPPPTLFPSLAPPTPTVTPRFTLVPSWTPTNAPQLVNNPQSTTIPVNTNTPAISPAVIEATDTPPPQGYAFIAQQGSPAAIAWTTFHPEAGCDWSGIAGQATSLNGEAVKGLFVQLGGSVNGIESVEKLAMTGLAEEYGPGGFEIILDNNLVATEGSLWIQLLDQQNLPISERVYFNTYAECEKNLIIVYFDQVR